MIIWLYGQPGSGKTTLAEHFLTFNPDWEHVDGDAVRKLNNNSKYGIQGRFLNHIAAIDICQKLQKEGKNIIVSMVTPYHLIREMVNEELKEVTFCLLLYANNERRGKEQFWVKDFEFHPDYSLYMNPTIMSVRECYEKIKTQILCGSRSTI